MALMKPGLLRDLVVLVVVFGVLLGGLFAFTGTWPPAVIVESSSMMHADDEVSYGRLGTIDPGDLVLVKHASSPEDVTTLVEGGPTHYGMPGDVVVYFPFNDRSPGHTPIIHRAVVYFQIEGTGANQTYRVRWDPNAGCEGGAAKDPNDAHWCVYGREGILIPSVPVSKFGSTPQNPQPYRPDDDATFQRLQATDGFLTKGDNPSTNRNIDQVSGLSPPVQLTWIEGKGRAEVPWLGLIKLALAGKPNERNPLPSWVHIGSAYAPKDLWVMLSVSLFVLVGVPLLYDGYKAIAARRQRNAPVVALPQPPTDLAPGRATLSFVELNWRAPTDASGVFEYRIYRDGEPAGSTRTTTYTDAGLQPGRTYAYTVSSLAADGTESARSDPVSVTTMASADRRGDGPASV